MMPYEKNILNDKETFLSPKSWIFTIVILYYVTQLEI